MLIIGSEKCLLAISIVIVEVLFWFCLVGGLALRYIFQKHRLGLILLILTPLIDLVLVGITLWELSEAGSSRFIHGFSAFYIGFTIAFGPRVVSAMDHKFKSKYSKEEDEGKGRNPQSFKAPSERYEDEMKDWKRCILGAAITLSILIAGLIIVGHAGSFWIYYWMIVMVFTVVGWWVIGPVRTKRRIGKAKVLD